MKQELSGEIEKLFEVKVNTPEVGKWKRIEGLNRYIKVELELYQEYGGSLCDDRKVDWEKLNGVFSGIIGNI